MFLQDLQERGLLYQCTNMELLSKRMQSESVCAYIGFDCTADSLHIGSMIQIMAIRKLQQYGHIPIILLGSATTRIGDPSGKNKARKILTADTIAKNQKGILDSIRKFLLPDKKVIIVDNIEWWSDRRYIEFLQTVGAQFSINRMLHFDSIKSRLSEGNNLSFLEFNYMIFQAYDFCHLYNSYDCILQIGGSDQWGNIVNGVELTKKIHNVEVFGLTTNLLTNYRNEKMGKTVEGAIWLNEDRLSIYDFWQYFRNIDDRDCSSMLHKMTELPLDKIAELDKLTGKDINIAKQVLATEVTRLCHGDEAAHMVAKQAKNNFSSGTDLIEYNIQEKNITLIDLLCKYDFVSSRSHAKTLVRSGAVKVDSKVIQDPFYTIDQNIVLTVAKKKIYKVIVASQ